MIERYKSKQMADIWSEESKFQAYLDVELASADAFSQLGIIPKSAVQALKKNARFNVARIGEIEEITKHDIVAFTKSVAEHLGDEKIWLHYGLTSTDVVDTANSIRLKKANDIIEEKIHQFIAVLKKQANCFKKTPCIGRTHGIHAEITCFGLKWARWYDAMNQHLIHFIQARQTLEVVKMSGAVGSYNTIPMEIDQLVATLLGLGVSKISTQVLPRHYHVNYFFSLTQMALTIEEIATEIRHLSRTEVGEVREAFSSGQKGSSIMPHKRNPIASENMCGCARLLKGYLTVALDNQNLWHERDISHSSTERIMFEDATSLIEYMLNRYAQVLDTIVVDEDKMLENIKLTYGVVFSSRILHALLDKQMFREDAYHLVQTLTFKAYDEKIDLYTLVLESDIVNWLTKEEIAICFDDKTYLQHTSQIYKRVGL